MPKPINISEARGKLPELAKYLARHPDRVVLVEHRDLDERIALTTERHLRYLEAMVHELKSRASQPFRLQGSISSPLSDEELDAALKELREKRSRAAEARLRDYAS
jgi:hypothetical protein